MSQARSRSPDLPVHWRRKRMDFDHPRWGSGQTSYFRHRKTGHSPEGRGPVVSISTHRQVLVMAIRPNGYRARAAEPESPMYPHPHSALASGYSAWNGDWVGGYADPRRHRAGDGNRTTPVWTRCVGPMRIPRHCAREPAQTSGPLTAHDGHRIAAHPARIATVRVFPPQIPRETRAQRIRSR